MKRLLAAVLVLLVPGVALAFDPDRHTPQGNVRIAILRSEPAMTPAEELVQEKVVRYLTGELKKRGIDAYETAWTYDDDASAENVDVDYYVELAAARANADAHGGVSIGGRDGEVSLGVVVSHVAAELRLYDAHTMDVLATETIAKRSSAVRPTSIGFGGGDVFAWIALPFFERQQYRSAAKAAAKDAAVLIADAVK
ncbi:MAG TPA: hypothetical protein VHW00_25050 [Thermoanaerobaculia bacterium]|nr:hypothetical protein [Thermoanaerobaculia bacterium]